MNATFSEAMNAGTINTTTFKLKQQGATTKVAAVVSYDAGTKIATLNPNSNLAAGATYKATVTTGAQDLAGNALDQKSTIAGNQPKNWSFTVAP